MVVLEKDDNGYYQRRGWFQIAGEVNISMFRLSAHTEFVGIV